MNDTPDFSDIDQAIPIPASLPEVKTSGAGSASENNPERYSESPTTSSAGSAFPFKKPRSNLPNAKPFTSNDPRGRTKRNRPTAATKEAIETTVLSLLEQNVKKGVIKTVLREKWGLKLDAIEGYISRARKSIHDIISQVTKEDRLDLIAESYHTYKMIASRGIQTLNQPTDQPLMLPEVSVRDTLAAQANIDRLLGLSRPILVSQTDPSGEYEQLNALRQKSLFDEPTREALAIFAERMAGISSADGLRNTEHSMEVASVEERMNGHLPNGLRELDDDDSPHNGHNGKY